MSITVINRKDADSDIIGKSFYIGRGTPFGNPWTHLKGFTKADFVVETRSEAIEKYKQWARKQIKERNVYFMEAFTDLQIRYLKGEDITLICSCKPLPCHGDFLKELLEDNRWVLNWFSNMAALKNPIVYQGIEFFSVENFFQAMKTKSLEIRKTFAKETPKGSKALGRKVELRNDWNDIKLDVMHYALKKKFSDPEWEKRLLESHGEIIEWNNWGDKFWGKCIYSNDGENHLGKLLMKIKNEKKNSMRNGA